MRNDVMNNLLRQSVFFYDILLLIYPDDFRRHFSDEMKEAFFCQMENECEISGLVGALRVWGLTLWELFSVAAPLQLQNTIVVAAGLSFLGSAALSLVFFGAVAPHCAK